MSLRSQNDLKSFIKGFVEKQTDAQALIDLVSSSNNPHNRGNPLEGGVLDNPLRKKRENDQGAFKLQQSSKGYHTRNEISLTRALFNRREMQVGDATHYVVAYEAPLLRFKEGTKGKAKCDLVTITLESKNNIVLTAVEAKCRGYASGDTSLPFGLLEAWAYGCVLAKYQNENDEKLRQEVATMCQMFGARREIRELTAERINIKAIRFALLFPRHSLETSNDILKDALRKLRKSKRLQNKELWVKEKLNGSCTFDGYWVIRNKVKIQEPGPGEDFSPSLDRKPEIIRYDTQQALDQELG